MLDRHDARGRERKSKVENVVRCRDIKFEWEGEALHASRGEWLIREEGGGRGRVSRGDALGQGGSRGDEQRCPKEENLDGPKQGGPLAREAVVVGDEGFLLRQ